MTTHTKIDISNMFESIYNFPDQMNEAIEIGKTIELKNKYEKISNIVISGMGGSAIGGDLCKSLANDSLSIPLSINRNYTLPNWVSNRSLVICSSYSGNTEESLSAYHDAKKKGAMILGISTGGELRSLLENNNLDCIAIPPGLQPRAAVSFSFIPLLYILHKLNVVDSRLIQDLETVPDAIKSSREIYCIEEESNSTYSLAKKIYGTLPIIYGECDSTSTIALRWKGQLCENAKMLAYHNEIPEMNHNEIVGWQENAKIMNQLSVLWISDRLTHPRNKLRIDSSKNILNDLPCFQKEVAVEGKNFVERFVHLIHFGDWLSFWCSILHETDPTPVKKIDALKEILSKKS